MSDPGPAVELIRWDPDTARYRWTYRRAGVHRTGEAWTREEAAQRLACSRLTIRATPKLPVRRPAGAIDRTRYRLGRGPG